MGSYVLYLYLILHCDNHACTALQTIVSVPSSVQTTFTARVGDTAVLQCPIAPGALLQSYSVRWMKDSTFIAERMNSQDAMYTDPERYDIDDAYSLLIHSVNVNDSSSNYRCVLFITNPRTDTKQEVQPYPNREIPLRLNIIGNCGMIHFSIILIIIIIKYTDDEITVSTLKPTSRVVKSPTEQPSFTCIANAPNITWTYINSGGEETNLIEAGVEHRIVSNVSDGNSTTQSTITFLELNLATGDSAIVRCKVCNSLGITAAELNAYGFFIISKSCTWAIGYDPSSY